METDLRPLHRAALAAADVQVRRVRRDDPPRPTPCAGWDLADLLAHMIGQHLGFAAAVRSGAAPHEAYTPEPYTLAGWERSVTTLHDAFARADLDGETVLVEISPVPRPVAFAVHAQLLDTVVHTWDVAAALGVPYTPATDLVTAVARGAAAVPDTGRDAPGAAFAAARPAHGGEWERALARLGRSASWRPVVG